MVDTGAQGVSVQMPQSVVQGDSDKILQWGYRVMAEVSVEMDWMEYSVSRAI